MSVPYRHLANAIRALSMDAIQAANSGHPGLPMGMADVATILFGRYLKFNPKDPTWPDRDRFVLSGGHGCMLLYSLLYLTGYDEPSLEDIKNFRQLGSRCAGHPENTLLSGVEATTGPLGQGIGMAAGMALAERHLKAQFGEDIVNHRVWTIAGDGCLMEGINHEVVGIAARLGLGNLNVLWDDNGITIDGDVTISRKEDVMARHRACGWHVVACDGHNTESIIKAMDEAIADPRPSLIACRTTIGYGSPGKQGTAAAHGTPLGEEEILLTREALEWTSPDFTVPHHILKKWKELGTRHLDEYHAWKERLEANKDKDEFLRITKGQLPQDFDLTDHKNNIISSAMPMATRKASEMALSVLIRQLPELVGGSADLTPSNNTKPKGMATLSSADYGGRYIHYGIREFGMATVMNGLALHGGVIPYGGTFLAFSDYSRPAIRLSALQKTRVVYVMTHDSIGVGEDGPTHQPIEQVMSLRLIPNLRVFRPADSVETAECWELALKNIDGPSLIVLSRQNLPLLRESADENLSARGAYRLRSAVAKRRVILMATGSEVSLAVEVADLLETAGFGADVVSMPSWTLFDQQPESYRNDVLPDQPQSTILRVSIEAGTTIGWERYTGINGLRYGIDVFGASAPANDLYAHFGLTAVGITNKVLAAIAGKSAR
ncbi:MAG: transketolase [Zymomonas mobilis]|uniref:transketolase n=2 Tax=Zymomonas mobilis TaxID=542 RepID=UPI0039EA5929